MWIKDALSGLTLVLFMAGSFMAASGAQALIG
jgi:hypothetical protein